MSAEAKRLDAAVQRVVERSKRAVKGAQVFVRAGVSNEKNVRLALNRVTTSGDVDRETVSLTLLLGARVATATSSALDGAGLDELVERVAALVKVAPEDPEAQPVLASQRYLNVPGVFDPAVAGLSAGQLAALARALVEPSRSQGLLAAGFVHVGSGVERLASSAGLWAGGPVTSLSVSVTARTADGQGSGREALGARALAKVDAARLGKLAAQTAVASAKRSALAPGRYSVVLEAPAVQSLLGFFMGSLDEREAEEGRSFFSLPNGQTKVGQRLFGEHVGLSVDPASPWTPCTPWDLEGLPRARVDFVKGGVLTQLARSRFWAAKHRRAPTAQFDGFVLSPGRGTVEELIAGVKRGVLIKRCWYTNFVDPKTLLVTGLTRDGTFVIEDGKVAGAVNAFRFNESVAGLLERCDAIAAGPGEGDDASVYAPALRTQEFNLASVSDAV